MLTSSMLLYGSCCHMNSLRACNSLTGDSFTKIKMATYTTIEKLVVSRINLFLFKEINTFIQQEWIKLIKIYTKDNVAKDFHFK